MLEVLQCPLSGCSLIQADRREFVGRLGERPRRKDSRRATVDSAAIPTVSLVRNDGGGAYPVIDGIPILLAPEMFVGTGRAEPLIDTDLDPYREAYEEMAFYNLVADEAGREVSGSEAYRIVAQTRDGERFPGPNWLDATFDIASQLDAYQFLAPVDNVVTLQLGGSGIHAVKFLLAGASESWLMTPMLNEAVFARKLAAAFGVEDRFRSVVGIAEEMPFVNAAFDRIYSGGCIHHTLTERAFPEIKRVLKRHGRFAAVEPWRAPLYKVGTRIFGKQERGVNCRPMESRRVAPLFQTFTRARLEQHGALSRYLLIAMGKLGVRTGPETVARITRLDDKVASKLSLSGYGSSVVLLADQDS